ncbi:putative holin [Pseudoxanthomonas mexicana]
MTTSTLGLIAAGVGLAALVPGIDGDALVGAFAGGMLFVVSTPSMPLWQRVSYFLVSAIAGVNGHAGTWPWFPSNRPGWRRSSPRPSSCR